jgi:hypothetical protein
MAERDSRPDFYLSSTEGFGLGPPRECYRVKRLSGHSRDDYLLIRISPPIVGQPYGLRDRDIGIVVIAPRHAGSSLFPVSEWPLAVHVARPLSADIELCSAVEAQDLEEIGWGELYESLGAATRMQSIKPT